jgi:hypothetical protein
MVPLVAVAAALWTPSPAHSQSGDGVDGDGRTKTGFAAICPTNVDVTYPCGDDLEGQVQCGVAGNVPIGYCEQGKFGDGFREVPSNAANVEAGVVVQGDSIKEIIQLGDGSLVHCRTFFIAPRRITGGGPPRFTSSGLKVCRQIFEGTCSTDSSDPNFCPPACDPFLPTVSAPCDDTQDALTEAYGVSGDPSYEEVIKFGRLPGQASAELRVCTSHRWKCFDPATRPLLTGVSVAEELSGRDWDNGCTRTYSKSGGTRYSCF